MKCDKCGFIYNKKVDVCPYCGNLVKKKKMSFFDRYVPLGNYSRMSVRSIIYIIGNNYCSSICNRGYVGREEKVIKIERYSY